jgi:DNA helicase-2/ATP-dependent DNA helicase PcrA
LTSSFSAFYDTLNPDQKEAVKAPEGPVLVFAGAGSGKTRVLTGRAFYLLAERNVKPESVIVMTFTNKAARELQERLQSYLGRREDLPWAGTFHSFCARMLRVYGEHIGLSRNFTIYDTDDTEQVLAGLLAEKRIVKDELNPAALRAWISLLKNGGKLTGRNPMHRHAEDLLPIYNERLRAAQAVDFDDLLRLPLELLEKNPDVCERIQRRYEHVLIDEFQDTNRIQYDLARRLAKPQDQLYVVGDDDQSIYGWRGADASVLLDFQHDLSGARVFHLEQNYRSTQPILDVANDLIAQNRVRTEKKLWTANKGGEKVTLRILSRAMDEAHEVVGEIYHLVRGGKFRWNDCAVLFRTNAMSRQFEEVLIGQAIPYAVVGGIRFYERKEVKDLLAYLRLMANPDDEQSWRRVFKSPPKGIGATTVERIEKFMRASGLGFGRVLKDIDALSDVPKAMRAKIQHVVTNVADLRQKIRGMTLEKQVQTVLDACGLSEYYRDQDELENEDRVSNLLQLVEAAREREREHPEYELIDFLNEIALVSDVDELESGVDRVTLMTLHSAKGLEFPVVLISGVEENVLPHQRSQGSAAEIEEERRLFYVGVTRARERLYLTCAQTRYVGGMLQFQEPSRFLRDIEPAKLRGWTLPPKNHEPELHDDDDFAPPRRRSHIPAPRSWSSGQQTNGGITPLVPFRIGDLVQHPDFGMGVVTAKSGDAADMKVRVAFEGVGSKLLAVKYAPLKKVE